MIMHNQLALNKQLPEVFKKELNPLELNISIQVPKIYIIYMKHVTKQLNMLEK